MSERYKLDKIIDGLVGDERMQVYRENVFES